MYIFITNSHVFLLMCFQYLNSSASYELFFGSILDIRVLYKFLYSRSLVNLTWLQIYLIFVDLDH